MKKAPDVKTEPFETIQRPDSDQRKPPERSGLFRQNEAQLADRSQAGGHHDKPQEGKSPIRHQLTLRKNGIRNHFQRIKGRNIRGENAN